MKFDGTIQNETMLPISEAKRKQQKGVTTVEYAVMLSRRYSRSSERSLGFSLLELLIVVAIILIIATIAIPSLLRSRQSAQESSAVAQIRTINTAEITYLSSNQGSFGNMPSLISQGLLDNRFSGSVSGYNYTVAASGLNYTVNADPTSTNAGRFGYYSLPDAVIRFATYQGGNCSPCYPGTLSGAPVQ